MMPSPISFILPLKILQSMITSSTAVAKLAGELEWNAASAYTVGQIVVRTDFGGRRFQNLIAGTNANKPEDDKERWYDLGVTGPLTMFDSEVSSQSMAPNALTVVFRPGAFNAMYLAGLDGLSLTIIVKEAPNGVEVYRFDGSLEDSEPADYYEYYFSPYKPKTEFLVTGLAPFANCEVTITISNPGSVARCGMASLGDQVSLGGPAMRGAKVKPKSYNKITTDKQGKTSVSKGKTARDISIRAQVPIEEAADVVDAVEQVNGIPCTWIGSDLPNLRTLRTFGLGTAEFSHDNDIVADLSLTVEGMI